MATCFQLFCAFLLIELASGFPAMLTSGFGEDVVLLFLKKATEMALYPASAHLLELVQRDLDLRIMWSY